MVVLSMYREFLILYRRFVRVLVSITVFSRKPLIVIELLSSFLDQVCNGLRDKWVAQKHDLLFVSPLYLDEGASYPLKAGHSLRAGPRCGNW